MDGDAMIISPILAWFLAGIAFYVIELILPGFVIFFFGAGAWCVALTLAVLDLSLSVQLMIFISCSLISLLLLRSWLRTVFLGDSSEQADSVTMTDEPATGMVVEAIVPPGQGRVQYGGSYWNAVADEPVPENTVVQVVEKKDLLIKVCALTEAKEEANG
jgi:membrane protein implicated in regulation of membrane protease activity